MFSRDHAVSDLHLDDCCCCGSDDVTHAEQLVNDFVSRLWFPVKASFPSVSELLRFTLDNEELSLCRLSGSCC